MINRETAKLPEDLAKLFVLRANEGDVEGLVALYESNAILVIEDGKLAIGSVDIRIFYEKLLASHPNFIPGIQEPALQNGGLALTSSHLTNGDITAEIARQQQDGTWKWVVDNPAIYKSNL